MRLNDPLVTEIEFQGNVYDLDLAFDNVLDVFDVLNDHELLPSEKLDSVCMLLIGENDLNYNEQLELFSEIKDQHIMINDETFVERDILGDILPSAEERTIDLELDAKFIFSSFFALGINLYEQQGVLSWLEFQALLESLPDESIMTKIIQIRRWEPSKGESPERVKEMRRLQKKYALPGTKGADIDE